MEMEWNDEWWDAIVIQVLPAKAIDAGNVDGVPVIEGEPNAVISHASDACSKVPCPTLQNGMGVDHDKVACKESGEVEDGAPRKADEADGWEAALGYMVKKCQVAIDRHDLGPILKPAPI